MTTTRGVVHIHSAPSALCPHIEWAIGGAFGVPIHLDWHPQPAERSSYRTEYTWRGPVGTAGRLASALKRWGRVRFEITEEATEHSEAERYSYTPSLGIFHAVVGLHGDIMVPEDRIKYVMTAAGSDLAALKSQLGELLGTPWDNELEIFRQAGDGVPVRWLHRVG